MDEHKKYYTSQLEIDTMVDELAHAYDLNTDKNTRYGWKKIVKMISSVVSVIIIVTLVKVWFDVMNAKAKGEVPTVFGYQVYEVQSGSMDPTLPVYSLILSKVPSNPSQLEVGDVVTFDQNGTTITHRIVESLDKQGSITYRTKGDNAMNSIDPEELRPEQIKAVYVTKLPFRLSSSEDSGVSEDE